jgi:hypothetical protein
MGIDFCSASSPHPKIRKVSFSSSRVASLLPRSRRICIFDWRESAQEKVLKGGGKDSRLRPWRKDSKCPDEENCCCCLASANTASAPLAPMKREIILLSPREEAEGIFSVYLISLTQTGKVKGEILLVLLSVPRGVRSQKFISCDFNYADEGFPTFREATKSY